MNAETLIAFWDILMLFPSDIDKNNFGFYFFIFNVLVGRIIIYHEDFDRRWFDDIV